MLPVLGALQGFSTIAAVISVGFVLAHVRVLGMEARNILADLAFFVASPALLLVVLSKAPVSAVLSWGLVVAAGEALLVMAIAAAIARWRWGMGLGETVLAALCSGYVNSGNLGLPIALYVLGDITYAAPVLLLQLLVLTPVSMTVLDSQLHFCQAGCDVKGGRAVAQPDHGGGTDRSGPVGDRPPASVGAPRPDHAHRQPRGALHADRVWSCAAVGAATEEGPRPGSNVVGPQTRRAAGDRRVVGGASGCGGTSCSLSSSWPRCPPRRTSSPIHCAMSRASISPATPSSSRPGLAPGFLVAALVFGEA